MALQIGAGSINLSFARTFSAEAFDLFAVQGLFELLHKFHGRLIRKEGIQFDLTLHYPLLLIRNNPV